MTTVLRQSGGTLARLSKASFQSSLRRSQRAPTLSSRLVRSYAAVPKKSNDKKDKKKDDAGDVAGRKTTEPLSKSAPGTEKLQNDGETASSPSPAPAPAEGDKPIEKAINDPLHIKLTPEDVAALDDVLRTLRMGMPKAQAEIVEKAFAEIKKEGMSPEVREMVDFMKSGKKMNLVTAAKFTRMVTTMSRKAQDQLKDESKEPGFDFKNNEQKSGPNFPFEPFGKTKNKGKQEQGGPNFGEIKLDTNTILLSAFVSYMAYRAFVPSESSRDITWQEFKTTFLDKGLVEKLTVVNGDRVRVDLHREATASMYPDSPASNPQFHYYFTIGSVEAFERKFDEAQQALGIPSSEQIPLGYVSEGSPLLGILLSFGPTALFLAGLYFLSRRTSGGGASGVFGMGKSRAKQFNHETEVKVKFKDVAGMDEAKLEIMEFVSFLKSPDQYKRLGAKIPRGAILSGPPGTGKTLLAKATAGESEVPFYSVSGSEFVEMFVGVGASRVRDLFATARKNAPCIIFIDEIDAIGKSRSKNGSFGGGNDEREATLNQILTEMDGFNTMEQVVVLAGTNRPDVLDKALMRPGRFDRHITIDSPTMEGRKQIFNVHLGKIVTNEDMDHLSGRLAALTPGFSGADIANCVNEAALIAARTSAVSVAMIHFEQAIERVIGGLEKKSLVLSPEEKKTVAYHEAGHAICGWYFKYADPLLKVSIIPRGQGALGYAQYLPKGDTYLMNVNQLMDRMAMTLGGRVSEELHFDTVTSGASDDFNKVTRLASAMVTKWGMSKKLGPLHYQDDDNKLHKPFAEATAQTIDSEVRRIVDEAYQQCKELLTEKKPEIGIIAEELLAKEVLTREDMVRLLGKRPFDDNEEFNKYFGGPGQGFGGGKSAPPAPQPFPQSELDTPEPDTPVI